MPASQGPQTLGLRENGKPDQGRTNPRKIPRHPARPRDIPPSPTTPKRRRSGRFLMSSGSAGIRLTESLAMYPGSSVSGLYFAHPKAKYSALARSSVIRCKDYAARKGMSLVRYRKMAPADTKLRFRRGICRRCSAVEKAAFGSERVPVHGYGAGCANRLSFTSP